MNKKGRFNIEEIIGGIFALFFAVIFFGIIFPMLSEISGNSIPGFGFLIFLGFLAVIVGIIASIIRAFGGRI